PWRRAIVRCAAVLGGAAIPLVALVLVVWRAGVFARFWFWTVVYARDYGYVGIRDAPAVLRENAGYLIARSYPLWALAAAGVALVSIDRHARRQALFAALLLVFAFVATSFSFIYRGHY